MTGTAIVGKEDDKNGRVPTFAELREEQRRKDEQREKAEKARVEAALAAHARSFADMIAMPAEEKANTQLALLTNGVIECMRSASLNLISELDPLDPRVSARRAEIRDAALLSMASARILEAWTRYQDGIGKQKSDKATIGPTMAVGAQALFISHEITPRLDIPAYLGMTGELVDAALAKPCETAESQKAKG